MIGNQNLLKTNSPHIIDFQVIGSSELGYISVAEAQRHTPFEIKRVYWIYYTPNNVQRGFHAHKELDQVLVAVSGIIHIKVIDQDEKESLFVLDDPSKGLYIPRKHWREISFSHSAVMISLVSQIYNEQDYIRDFDEFKNYKE